MRLVVDTNVFISGVFFSGPPFEILDAWKKEKVEIILSEAILEEYCRIGDALKNRYPAVNLDQFLSILISNALIVHSPPLDKIVCSDPDDDKFLACALASQTGLVCSGDKSLLRTSGYKGIKVVTPRAFVDCYLK